MATIELNGKPYVVRGTVSREVIEAFAPPVRTIGQQSRADVVPYSQWVIGDVTEGVGVLDGRFPGDEKRIWDSGLQTHFKSGWTLPSRRVVAARSGGAATDFPQYVITAEGTLYMLTLRQDPVNTGAFIASVYSYAANTWTFKDSVTLVLSDNSSSSSTSSTGGGREGARLGRPTYWGGAIWAPCGPAHENEDDGNFDRHRSYLFKYDIAANAATLVIFAFINDTTNANSAPDTAAASVEQPLALIQHRGNLVALTMKPDTNKLSLFRTTAESPSSASWTSQMSWQGTPEKDGTTHLLRPGTPIWLEEGLDQDGNAQLYILVRGTVWRANWSGAVVQTFLQTTSDFAMATAVDGRQNHDPLAPQDAMVWWQNGLVTADQDGRVYHSTPSGVSTLIGLTRDDGPAVSGVELFRGFSVVADLLLSATQSRAMIFNQKGWSTLHDDKTAATKFIRVYWDGTQLHLGQEEKTLATTPFVLDINDLDRVVQVGGRTFDDVASTFNTELETPKFDGGFPERPGLAYRINVRADDVAASETVKVEFQTDAAAYATAGTMTTGKTATFTLGTGGIGIPFKWIQLRITLDRGADNTKSPFVISVILDYDKLEKVLERFEFVIDAATSAGSLGGKGRSVSDIQTEITNIAGENATALSTFKWADVDTKVRVTRVGGAAASTARIGRADFQEAQGLIAVTVEER